jgi:dipeptidyl aminopeptidase/acylaminoacyl peptidase
MPSPEERLRKLPDREAFTTRTTHRGFECVQITYLSGSTKVIGFIFKPIDTAGKRLPLIVYARGGSRDFGKIVPDRLFLADYTFLEQGFVILASQYRGVDGGEGHDEFGGQDLGDILSLIPLAQSLDYVDSKNLFLYGFSRGGMMTFLALKNGIPVNAAAVSAGPTDLASLGQLRPEMAKNYREMIPGYETDPVGTTRERSALQWPEKINTPLLLLHGTADWRVPTTDTLQLALKLQQLHKTYAVEIFSGDVHGLPLHNDEAHLRVVSWFRQYMK